ncbi:hypothetical protein BDN71DRAFT_1428242 [Pleurotus eryngii]|uniref:Uncharacterized protein n=1 Tax=Pleurotus eryngii TaxID=5323 RepID=A0A9P6A541_PLEER|nr:hypothetical protein BDN71DRAFT_1428242 [Pleurotus eryngii]
MDFLVEITEPYLTTMKSLMDTVQLLHKLPGSPSVLKLREQVQDFVRIVGLDLLTAEVNKHWARLSDKLTSGGLRWILLGIFSTDGWIRICRHVEVLIKAKKEWLERVICLLVSPQWRHLLRDEYGETRRRIKDVGLSSDLDKTHLDVHTIWTQEPARFNLTTTEFSLLLSSVDVDIPSGAPSLAELLGSQALSKVVDLSTRSAALFHPTEHEAPSDDERHPIVPFTSEPPLPIQRCATSPGILDLFSAERATKQLSITVGPNTDQFHITGRVHTLTINSHRGDNFTAPISGGIVGGVRNSNHVENFGPWED